MPKSSKNIAGVYEAVFHKTFALYWKTHTYHWNIEGKNFLSLHEVLGKLYTSLWESLDDIAERLRIQGLPAPESIPAQTVKSFGVPADTMLKNLLKDYEDLIEELKKGITVLEERDDLVGADFLTGLLASYEKTAWMIRSSI